jgi:adenylate cyclase
MDNLISILQNNYTIVKIPPVNFSLAPKARRNLYRILPFPVIWILTGWVFMLVEFAATGSTDPSPAGAIQVNLPVMLFAAMAMALVGLLVGLIELVYLENLFRSRSFLVKTTLKLTIYTLLFLLIIVVTYPIAASLELGVPVWHSEVWIKFNTFLHSWVFFSTLLQMAWTLLLCLIYAAISENLGQSVLSNVFTGKYHHPREEVRIFMFLDIKDSTRIAEQLGHQRYFLLLRDFYDHLGNAIIEFAGEVYQYIGDEIVISWIYHRGIENNNCLKCFFTMKEALHHQNNYYQQHYGLLPDFKAGLHFGNVTTGEIGALKKEIAFSGDVLNTTSRLQNLCNQYQADLLVSSALVRELPMGPEYKTRELGEVALKGRKASLEVVEVIRL